MRGSRSVPACLLCVLFLLSQPVLADGNQALLQLLKALHDNGTINDATYSLIIQTAQHAGTTEQPAPVQTAQQEKAPKPATVSRHINGETIAERKKKAYPTLEIGARIHMDAAMYDKDVSVHNDGTELRRVTVDFAGDIGPDWDYKIQYDFTKTGAAGISHAWIEYLGFDWFSLRLGHVKEPFSLDNMGSSNNTTFIERGLPYDAFVEGRNLGLRFHTRGRNWSFEAGAFGKGEDGPDDNHDEGAGVSARLTYVPILENRHILHLGGSVSYRATGSDDILRFRARPESHVTDTRLVDTGNFLADDFTRLGAELAYINGPFAVLGEYMQVNVDRGRRGRPGLGFNGYYAEASWFLTGESMDYRGTRGTIGRVTPFRYLGYDGWGALQLAARISHVDLTDSDINGGVEDNMTLGINWYPLPYLRFSADYIKVLNLVGGPHDGDEPSIFTVRTDMEF